MKLLLKKRSAGGSVKNMNTIGITKSVVSIRKNIIDSIGLNKKSSGSIGYNDAGEVCIFFKLTPHKDLFSLTSNAKDGEEINHLYINISKHNREAMSPLIGTYVIEKTVAIAGELFECKLKKMY